MSFTTQPNHYASAEARNMVQIHLDACIYVSIGLRDPQTRVVPSLTHLLQTVTKDSCTLIMDQPCM